MFVAFDCSPQFRLQPKSGHHRVVHGRLEDLETGLALGLGGIHGDVGVAQQLARGVAVAANCDADAGADVHLLAEHPERRAEGAANPLGDSGRGRDVGVLEENRKLVAAQPRGSVLRPQGRPDPMRRLDQDMISRRVAEAVVDRLEVVQVDE